MNRIRRLRSSLSNPSPLWFPILLLVVIEIIIFLTNFASGTYLIGWDNIMPEFNLPLNLQRSLISLWQDYRGLGTLDGLSHAANLMHTIYIWLLSLVIPQNALRYVFIHLTHLVGGIGMYLLLTYLLTSQSSEAGNKKRLPSDGIAPIFAALFYMLNIGTIQMYYAPLEVFATHFAALPFLVLQILRTLRKTNANNLFLLFLVSLLFSPQGFVPTVFIVFLMLFGSLLFFALFNRHPELDSGSIGYEIPKQVRHDRKHILSRLKKTLLISAIVFAGNAFWLLPFFYSAIHTPAVIQETKINQIASEEIFYRNKAHGDIMSVLSFRGFMLSTVEFDMTVDHDTYFMQRWVSHTDTLLYKLFFFICVVITLLGVIQTIRTRNRLYYPFLLTAGICFLFLANNTLLLEQFNTWFRSFFPVLGEAFRFPFTKFITVFVFCATIFFGFGIEAVIKRFQAFKREVAIILTILFLYLSLPVFQGYFTSPYLRLNVPESYLALFTYMKDQDSTRRIAILPVHTFWNWQFRSWGHRGSGFLWYGLKQPILERAFDPWSLENEQYYREMANAVNRQDPALFRRVLTKYRISYVLVDESLLNSLSRQPIDYASLESFLNNTVGLEPVFTAGNLVLYRTPTFPPQVSTIPLAQTIETSDELLGGRSIGLEALTSTYYTGKNPSISPLFPSLATEKLQGDIPFTITKKPFSISLSRKTNIPLTSGAQSLIIPSLFKTEFLVPVRIEKGNSILTLTPLYPTILLNNQAVTLPVHQITLTPHIVTNPTTITMVDIKHVIPMNTTNPTTYLMNPYVNTLKLSDGRNEEILTFDTATQDTSPISIPLSQTNISSIIVDVPTFSSPYYYQDLLKRRVYQIHEIARDLPSITGKREAEVQKNDTSVSLSARGTSEELSFFLDNLPHQGSYLLYARADQKSGLPINFYVDNSYHKRAELETVLAKGNAENVIILPKTEEYFLGYGFHFTVKSVGNELAKATLEDVAVYPFPVETLSRIFITDSITPVHETTYTQVPLPITQTSLSSYETVMVPQNSLVTLAEAYDPGWRLYTVTKRTGLTDHLQTMFPFFLGTEVKTHTKVNNWANGWIIPEERGTRNQEQLTFVYLPQYLQYGGLLLTLCSGLLVLLMRTSYKKKEE